MAFLAIHKFQTYVTQLVSNNDFLCHTENFSIHLYTSVSPSTTVLTMKCNWNKTVLKLFCFSQNKKHHPSQPMTAEVFCFGWNILESYYLREKSKIGQNGCYWPDFLWVQADPSSQDSLSFLDHPLDPLDLAGLLLLVVHLRQAVLEDLEAPEGLDRPTTAIIINKVLSSKFTVYQPINPSRYICIAPATERGLRRLTIDIKTLGHNLKNDNKIKTVK